MLTGSSAAQANIRKNAKFDFSVNFLPYHDDIKGAPQNSHHRRRLPVGAGRQDSRRLQGRGAVLQLPVASPKCRRSWHQLTGYVPITNAAAELTRKSGFYEKNPGTDIAVKQLNNKPPTANSKGLRFGNFVQGRTVIEEEMEAVLRRQEGRQGGHGRRRPARQRDPAQVRGRQQVITGQLSRRRDLPRRRRCHGKTRRLPLRLAAVSAGGAADRDHGDLLLLAGGSGAVVRLPAPGRLRPERRVRRPGELPRPVQRLALPRVVQGHGAVQRCWWPSAASSIALLLAVHGRPRGARARWPTARC